jgi:hypothetical protein
MAIDQLKAADLVFDSYVNEFVLGKKRVMVPQSLASIEMQKDGASNHLRSSDVLIYVYQQSQDGADELKPLDMTLRSAEHEAGLQRMIDSLSKSAGWEQAATVSTAAWRARLRRSSANRATCTKA